MDAITPAGTVTLLTTLRLPNLTPSLLRPTPCKVELPPNCLVDRGLSWCFPLLPQSPN